MPSKVCIIPTDAKRGDSSNSSAFDIDEDVYQRMACRFPYSLLYTIEHGYIFNLEGLQITEAIYHRTRRQRNS